MKSLKRFLEDTCDQYCESMTDQEFNWLIDGLEIKIKAHLVDIINEM